MKKALILDMDETLVFSEEEKTKSNYDLEFTVGKSSFYTVYRPYLFEFIDYIKNHFEIYVWTSASRDYAEVITKEIFKDIPYTLLARDFSEKRIVVHPYHLEDIYNYPKLKKILIAQRFWGKNEFKATDTFFLHIKELSKFIKVYGKNIKDIICIDNDPYKFQNSFGNYWAIKTFFGQKDDKELLKYIQILEKLKNLPDVRIKKQNLIKEFELIGE